MNLIVAAFLLVNVVALLVLPRRWATVPLLVGACYMTRGQTIDIGSASFTVVRVLVLVGFIRIAIRGEWVRGGIRTLDLIFVAWGLWMIGTVAFHPEPDSPLMLRVRDVYEAWGLYWLFRVFCQTVEDVEQNARILALVLMPIAVAMIIEKFTGFNEFSRFGGVQVMSTVRNGVIRAQGPFAHSILAGSIGGVCIPLMATIWLSHRKLAIAGIAACLAIVLASGSSGPILAVGAGIGVLLLWRWRERMRTLRWAAFAGYVLLDLVMKRPAYFIIADIDLMGGSTAWHRSELIRSTIAHFGEWWLVGTDYTRHWMPSGVMSSPNQTDITNHYIVMGVVGGLVLMLLFLAIIVKAFWYVGEGFRAQRDPHRAFQSWAVGACLFAHAVTCLSVSYYDHSILFLYLTLAATAATLVPVGAPESVPATTRVTRQRAVARVRSTHRARPTTGDSLTPGTAQ